jgi:transposase InsO family protein
VAKWKRRAYVPEAPRGPPEGVSLLQAFDDACEQAGIAHRPTTPGHPWTNGQVARMNRTLKDATVKRCADATHQQLEEHLDNFLHADNFAKRLKTLHGPTPYEYIVKCRPEEPERCRSNPY